MRPIFFALILTTGLWILIALAVYCTIQACIFMGL
jgi:hypothetical protein